MSVFCAFILHTCGPKDYDFEGLKATGTGKTVKSAAFSYWRSKGIMGPNLDLPCGGFSCNSGNYNNFQVLINRLDEF